MSSSPTVAKCLHLPLHRQLIKYDRALQWQRALQAGLVDAPRADVVAHLITLQHPPCYTMGRVSSPLFVLDKSLEVHKIERGGEVTFHGPGQLVGYFIANLDRAPLKRDLHWLLRSTEEVIITALMDMGVRADRKPGRSGVWLGGTHKVAAVGFGVKRWVTCHGWSVNFSAEALRGFDAIVPCGIPAGEGLVGTLQLADPDALCAKVGEAYASVFGLAMESTSLRDLGLQ